MSQIPIVQGVPVQQQQPSAGIPAHSDYSGQSFQQQSQYVDDYGGGSIIPDGGSNFKGEMQPKQYQDVGFAIAFILHLVVMMIVMAMYTTQAQSSGLNYSGIIWCVCTCALVAVGLSSLALGGMMKFATELVKMALIFSVGLSLVVAIMGALSGEIWMAIMGFGAFALGCCYAYFVWSRIPFAAANLKTALVAVRQNLGLALVAYILMCVAFAWSLWWTIAASAALTQTGIVMFLFLLSYYWVHQVLKNTVHVTCTGVVGTWWHFPEEASACCSPAIMDSLGRATTYSFGSICFGSFLVAIIQALRAMHRIAHENDDCSFLVCLIDCILACIEGIIEYINKWAYVYVGLYGFSYLEAGRNVIQLFQNKGWTTIITDDLADNVLSMVSVAIGLFTGLIGLVIGKLDASIFEGIGFDNSGSTAGFLVGFLIGFLFASIMMSVVGSAVNTIIVLFAESPAEFQANHPELSEEMRLAWRQAWPVECGNL